MCRHELGQIQNWNIIIISSFIHVSSSSLSSSFIHVITIIIIILYIIISFRTEMSQTLVSSHYFPIGSSVAQNNLLLSWNILTLELGCYCDVTCGSCWLERGHSVETQRGEWQEPHQTRSPHLSPDTCLCYVTRAPNMCHVYWLRDTCPWYVSRVFVTWHVPLICVTCTGYLTRVKATSLRYSRVTSEVQMTKDFTLSRYTCHSHWGTEDVTGSPAT